MVPGARWVLPMPLARTSTRAPASAARTAADRPATPAPITTASYAAAGGAVAVMLGAALPPRPGPEPVRAPLGGARRPAAPGRPTRQTAPGAAGRRRGSA